MISVNGVELGGTSGGSVAVGDLTDISATGEAVATGTAAQGRTALSVYSQAQVDAAIAGTRIAPTFESGQGWSIVAASTPSEGSASLATASGSPVGRLALTSTGDLHGITGPRIERAFPSGVETFKARVRLRSLTGSMYVGLYVRDGSSALVIFALPNGSVARETPLWNIDGPGSAGEVTFDATCFLSLRGNRSLIRNGSISGSDVWTPRSALSYFEPTHIGVIGLCDGPQTASADVDTFSLETFG